MTRPTLCLFTRTPIQDSIPMHTSAGNAQLWELVTDKKIHLILREPAMQELARRKDTGVMNLCEELLNSDNIEEWFVAVRILGHLHTSNSIERLIKLYTRTNLSDRVFITRILAKILYADYAHPFSIMVRNLAVPGELDVTGWTAIALTTLKNACKRFGVEIEDESLIHDTHQIEVESTESEVRRIPMTLRK